MRSSGVPMTAAPAPSAPLSDDLVEQLPRVLDLRRARPAEHAHVVLVVPAVQAVHGLAPGLLLGLGDVPAHQHPPVARGRPCVPWPRRPPRRMPIASAGPAALRRSVEAIESTPMPYLPAICIPLGLMLDAVAIGMRSCMGRICSAASWSVNQSDFVAEAVLAAAAGG